jgi:hypothetical protein
MNNETRDEMMNRRRAQREEWRSHREKEEEKRALEKFAKAQKAACESFDLYSWIETNFCLTEHVAAMLTIATEMRLSREDGR